MEISISTPYRENSIVNIARAAVRSQELEHFYTTLYLGRWHTVAKKVPIFGNMLAQEFSRRAFHFLPSDSVINVGSVSELVHIFVRRILGGRHPAVTANLMYAAKRRFDESVACYLTTNTADVMIGMYAACAKTLETVRKRGGLTVLNFVNSHPTEHNRYLIELAGLKEPHHELMPTWITERIGRELNAADIVLVPSNFVAKQLMRHGIPTDKIVMIPYGVDLTAFYPREGERKNSKIVECLYVGQISHRKGIQFLLEAASRCKRFPVRFRLVGPIVSPKVLDGMPQNVQYDGAVLPGDVANLMRHADIFVLPTLEDSFALVALEAMASGLAVITTTHAGSSEVLYSGQDSIVVEPGNAQVLADAIQSLVDDGDMRKYLGQNARSKVADMGSWADYTNKVLNEIKLRRWRTDGL